MRRKKSASASAATTAAPVKGVPYTAEMPYRDFIKDIFPIITPVMQQHYDPQWTGAGIYPQADEFIADAAAFNGALPKIQSLYNPTDMYIPASPSHDLTFIRDTYGEVLDTDAYMAGEAECFITLQPAEVQKSNLTMRVIHGMSSGVDAAEAVKRYMLLADLYTAALSKYNVRIIFEWGGKLDNGNSYLYKLNVCDFGQPLDPYTLVSALSTPMYRATMRGLAYTLNGSPTSVDWHPTHRKYCSTPAVQRVAEEIVISPMFYSNFDQWELPKMLIAGGIIEAEA